MCSPSPLVVELSVHLGQRHFLDGLGSLLDGLPFLMEGLPFLMEGLHFLLQSLIQ